MENQQKNSAPENNSDNRNSNNNKKKPSKTVVIWIVSILLTFMIWQGITAIQQSKQEKITYDTFLQMLDDKLVTDVKLYNDRISFTPISKETGAEMDKTYYVIRISDYKIVDRLQKAGVQFEEMDEGKNAVVSTILSYVVMIGAFYLLMSLLMRNMSKSGGSSGRSIRTKCSASSANTSRGSASWGSPPWATSMPRSSRATPEA